MLPDVTSVRVFLQMFIRGAPSLYKYPKTCAFDVRQVLKCFRCLPYTVTPSVLRSCTSTGAANLHRYTACRFLFTDAATSLKRRCSCHVHRRAKCRFVKPDISSGVTAFETLLCYWLLRQIFSWFSSLPNTSSKQQNPP